MPSPMNAWRYGVTTRHVFHHVWHDDRLSSIVYRRGERDWHRRHNYASRLQQNTRSFDCIEWHAAGRLLPKGKIDLQVLHPEFLELLASCPVKMKEV